ncbi:MAG: hypothetical protein KAU35_06055 [candidate division Zixibacteria bacterium]|nr:hypothetical protein [candidate division Zixibacteria bacterium]
MIKRLLPLILMTTLVIWTAGCSDRGTESATESGTLNLEDPFGGYTSAAEKPAFGDTELLTDAEADEEYDDPILLSPGVDLLTSEDSEAGRYHMRILWGKLRYDPNVTDVTDWTGSLTVSRGVEIIRRVIRFELGQDYIPTRTDPALIEWVSFTTVHNDGIAVDILIPLDPDAVDPEPVTVTFETGPYSRAFSLEELMSLDTIVYLEDSNAVAFHAFKLDHVTCMRGFLSGRWGYDENDEGRFRAVWRSRNGQAAGYVTGHFGVNDDGQKVIFGKLVSRDGQFEGFIRGTYDHHASRNANRHALRRAGGWFQGGIYDADGVEIGVLRGKYRSHPSFKNGFLQGRWKLRCNSIEVEPDDIDEGF